jgi:phospholipid/cholesterol/gamma-HCH transport system substrate-binding protein
VRPAWNRALAVGALAAVTGAAFLLALTFFKKGGYSERESYLVHAFFSDATGITWKTRAQIAGIPVGEVSAIELVGTKARLDIRVKKTVDLHTDACLTKNFPSALLPDALLEVQPGSADKPLLTSLPESERNITCVREATSMQQLINSLAKIAGDIQVITGDLAQTVAGNRGLREIVENLASATKRIDDDIARNEQSFADIMSNTAAFTRDLREITGRDKDKVGRILTNVEELSARLKVVTASLQEIIDPGSGGGSSPAPPPAGVGATGGGAAGPVGGVSGAVAAATPEERAAAAQQARGVKQAVDKLTGSLERLEELLGKVNEGKSVAGRLLVDERLGRKVGEAAENLADQLDRVFKLQVQVQLRSEWLLNQTGAKTYFGIRLLPRPDKYYLLEIVSDPRGVDSTSSEILTVRDPITGADTTTVSTRTTHQDKLTFTLEIAKRYGPVTFRAGIIESSGGVGSDLHLFDDRLQFSISIYQFSRPYQNTFPRAKFWANYYVFQHFYATVGADDFLNTWKSGRYPGGPKFAIGNDVLFGAGLYFTDDDLKTLIGAGAGSAVSVR